MRDSTVYAQLRAGTVTGALLGTTLTSLIFAMLLPHLMGQNKKGKEDLTARAVQGTVMSPDEKPVVGAVVQIEDMRTLQVRSYITQADGTYHFTGLKTDVDYQLKAKSEGLESGAKTLSVFDDRKNAIINLKLEKK